MIFGFSLNVRAYFELFRDIADMYGDVNTKFIGPGLEIVNSMQSAYGASNDPAEQQKVESRHAPQQIPCASKKRSLIC